MKHIINCTYMLRLVLPAVHVLEMRGVGLVVVARPVRVRGGSGTAQLHPLVGDLLRAYCKGAIVQIC